MYGTNVWENGECLPLISSIPLPTLEGPPDLFLSFATTTTSSFSIIIHRRLRVVVLSLAQSSILLSVPSLSSTLQLFILPWPSASRVCVVFVRVPVALTSSPFSCFCVLVARAFDANLPRRAISGRFNPLQRARLQLHRWRVLGEPTIVVGLSGSCYSSSPRPAHSSRPTAFLFRPLTSN